MDSVAERGIRREVLQKGQELGALSVVEHGQQFRVVFVGPALGFDKQAAGDTGQVHRVRAPIRGMTSSLHETPVLEVVDQAHHCVPVDPHRVGELLLGLTVAFCQVCE